MDEKKLSRAKLDDVVETMREFYDGHQMEDEVRTEVYRKAADKAEEMFGGDSVNAFALLNIISGAGYLTGEIDTGKAADILAVLGWEVTA